MVFGREEKRAKARKEQGRSLLRTVSQYAERGVIYHEEFIVNSRGNKLFTTSWLPADAPPRALIFLIHGYGLDCSLFFSDSAIKLVSGGYAVHGLDNEGHGMSDGLQAYIPSIDPLVEDFVQYSHEVKAKQEYARLRCFMMAMSLGGAIGLLAHRREPTAWDGAIFLSPMCKTTGAMKASPSVLTILKGIAVVMPKAKVVPEGKLKEDPLLEKKMKGNPMTYQGKPRLATALTLLRTGKDLEEHLHDVTIPFLCLHCEEDQVVEPGASKALYEAAASKDKALKLYPGLCHGPTEGGSEEVRERVWKDIFEWLEGRCARAA